MASNIQIIPLGAGQQVGRSCIVVKFKDEKTVIFDSGIHMQYNDMQKYPDYQYICKNKDINQVVDLVIITHFHLDHCGALPYLTQHFKYRGPIIATTPTKAMIPYMLQDFRKVTSDIKKEQKNHFTYSANEGKESAEKITSIGLRQTIKIGDIKITSYYAGHVLGAGMFFVEYDGLSVLYTGDYNSYADRHLGAAYAPRLNPNVIITQTTYASTIRDTKRDRQRKMLKIVTETLEKGGKVLIPVFALGRAQQLSVLLETYWKRTDSKIPVYFSAGLIQKANFYYKLFVEWENQKIKEDFLQNNTFDFKKVKPFDKSLIRADIPYVLFATPGMLHGGTSLQVFKQWCGDKRNTLIIPGYCVPGTFGNKLLNKWRNLDIDNKSYQVHMNVENISFSAHADAKGIINLIRHVNAEKIVFVHGDKQKMATFKDILIQQLNLDNQSVFMPANKHELHLKCQMRRSVQIQGEQQPAEKGYLLNKTALGYSKKMNRQNMSQTYQMIKDEQEILNQLNLIKELFDMSPEQKMISNEIQTVFKCRNAEMYQKIVEIRAKQQKQMGNSAQQQYKQTIKEYDMLDGDILKKQTKNIDIQQKIQSQSAKNQTTENVLTGSIHQICKNIRLCQEN